MIVHLTQDPVVALGVERAIVGLRHPRFPLPELRGFHAPDRVANPEFLAGHASVVVGQLAEPAAVEPDAIEEVVAPAIEGVAPARAADAVAPAHHPSTARASASSSRPDA